MLDAVREFNYFKNVHATRLATGRSDLFGLVISESEKGVSPFTGVTEGSNQIGDAKSLQEFSLTLLDSPDRAGTEKLPPNCGFARSSCVLREWGH